MTDCGLIPQSVNAKINLRQESAAFSNGVKPKGEVTELVPVPDFKSAVTVREYGEVSSILMLSRQIKKPSRRNREGSR